MTRKSTSPLKIDGKIFESRLKHAKELFGSQNYQLYFHDQRVGFICVASPAQVIDACHAKANFSISTLDGKRACYAFAFELEKIIEWLGDEQFILCTYWIVFNP